MTSDARTRSSNAPPTAEPADAELAHLQKKLADCSRLLKATTSGLVSLNKSGLIDGVNPKAAEMLGAEQRFLLKKPISMFIAPEELSTFFIFRSRISAGDPNDPVEMNLRKKDGTIWSARLHAHLLEEPGQRLPGMLLAIEDITPHRQALEALQFKEDFITLFFSIIDDLASWTSADIDEIIGYCLEKVGLICDADRVYICLLHNRRSRISITHEWLADGIQSPAADLEGAPLTPFSMMLNQIKKRQPKVVEDAASLAPELKSITNRFHAPGTRSFLYAPLSYGRYLLGIIGCDVVDRTHNWPAETQHLVKAVGAGVMSALLRRQTERMPAKVKEALFRLVPSQHSAATETLEYEGPIEVVDEAPSAPSEKKEAWRIEAGTPDDPTLVGSAMLKDGRATSIACKNCNRQKQVLLEEIQRLGTGLKATCVCGNQMYVKVELRREHRKQVKLEGIFMRGPGDRIALKSDDWGRILITNISRSGLGFQSFERQDIRVKDQFRVKFTLDNTARSVIQKEVVVRAVNDQAIGCEFVGKDPCDVNIGFYLMT